MGLLEEMLLRNSLIQRNADGSTSILSDCAVRSGLTITDSSGRVTHRVENSTWPGELVLRNLSTGLVEERIRA
ncbi:hypothetical protein IJ103_03385 [Candidatus Saccharibacteria bacterium]|nr:hypothetical protein [Candidatus Saccharibacteria bacterium]MBQ9017252.1 hypothetical protein [Candidatus Saccharibacteria bacterium]